MGTTTGDPEIAEYAAVGGFALALVAVCLSAVSLGLHYLKRDEHPDVTALQARCDAMQLTQTDMLDRIEHWTRRDRVRRLRDANDDKSVEAPQQSVNPKDALRQAVMQRRLTGV